MIAIAGFVLIAAFLVTVAVRRAYWTTALILGSLPALFVAMSSASALLNPLGLLYLVAIWLPFLIAALVGAWLGKLVHAPWRRA